MKMEGATGVVLCVLVFFGATALGEGYELCFSTFFGGSAGDGIRDVEADGEGNIYVAGTTRSADFPATPGAFDEKLDTSEGESRWGYNADIFVAKFSPDGQLIWSTLIGGPEGEEAYGLEIDSKGFVVVHGRGAKGSPITKGVYQEEFKGHGGGDAGNPHYTAQNAYICKLKPDGSGIVWASFFGIHHLHRDLVLDKNDDIYATWGVCEGKHDGGLWNTWMKPEWNAHAFRPKPLGDRDCGVAKIAGDGSKVIWATYMGGSGADSIEGCIRVDDKGCPYVCFYSFSTDLPTTEGAFCKTNSGGADWYVAKLKADGSDIIYGTYVGDEGNNWLNTHNLAIDDAGNCYSSTCAFSATFPTTEDAVQRTYAGEGDWGIIKLSPTGSLAACTLFGGAEHDNPDGIRVDRDGNLVVFGQSKSADFAVSKDAYQSENGGGDDAVVVKFSPNLDKILYATYLGGDKNDAGRAGCVDRDGNLIVAGSSAGGTFPLKAAWQSECRGPGDAMIAKFAVKDKD